jgi:NAD(P)-dependent dehydrogenase (short-subunit alcohol dehydrogenase family)
VSEREAAQVVLVTGSGRGIGLATAKAFASRGAHVVLHARTRASLDAGLDAVRSALDADPPRAPIEGGGARRLAGVVADVRDAASVAAMFGEVDALHGRLDVLVNNAGVTWVGPFEAQSPAEIAALVETNLRGAYLCMAEAVLRMRRSGAGTIVNVSSNLAGRPLPGFAAYGAVKAALSAMSEAWSDALAPEGIKVCEIQPGAVDTEMASAGSAHRPSSEDRLVRLRPEAVAAAILQLVEQARSGRPRLLVLEHTVLPDGTLPSPAAPGALPGVSAG